MARAAVYRRWPYMDLFFADLLVDLASGAAPTAVAYEGADAFLAELTERHLASVGTAAGRHELAVELFRLGAQRDLEVMSASREWRTYLALHATFQGLADGEVRDEVGAALARSEVAFVERLAASYRDFAALLGYRLRAEPPATFEMVATLASATMRGLVLMALSRPELVTARFRAQPFGTTRVANWSVPALGLAALATSLLEPDPTVVWNRSRVAQLRALVASTGRPPSVRGKGRDERQ